MRFRLFRLSSQPKQAVLHHVSLPATMRMMLYSRSAVVLRAFQVSLSWG